jgi:hypothetical protein
VRIGVEHVGGAMRRLAEVPGVGGAPRAAQAKATCASPLLHPAPLLVNCGAQPCT